MAKRERTGLNGSQHSYDQMASMLSGERTDQEILNFLIERNNGNTTPELLAFLQAIKDTSAYVVDANDHTQPVLDMSGTGGDQLKTVNITTLAALLAAATDQVMVYKYGNKAATSVCGSMDVLEELGVGITLNAARIKQIAQDVNFVPLFARLVYPGAKHVATARKELGQPSIFNLLFPLARPMTGPFSVVMGFAKQEQMITAAEILQAEGGKTLLVHGHDGSDEISVAETGKSEYLLVANGKIESGTIDINELYGINPVELSQLQIQDKQDATQSFLDVINPAITSEKIEAMRLATLVNAAAAIALTCYPSEDILENMKAAFPIVEMALRNGSALELLKKMQEVNPYVSP